MQLIKCPNFRGLIQTLIVIVALGACCVYIVFVSSNMSEVNFILWKNKLLLIIQQQDLSSRADGVTEQKAFCDIWGENGVDVGCNVLQLILVWLIHPINHNKCFITQNHITFEISALMISSESWDYGIISFEVKWGYLVFA